MTNTYVYGENNTFSDAYYEWKEVGGYLYHYTIDDSDDYVVEDNPYTVCDMLGIEYGDDVDLSATQMTADALKDGGLSKREIIKELQNMGADLMSIVY